MANNQHVSAGDPIFRLDTSRQRAAANTAKRRIAEVDAALSIAEAELRAAEGEIQSARSALVQAESELTRRHGGAPEEPIEYQ